MRPLPSGTVTFLFSDIEGSTRLLDELGAAAYAEALAEHRRLLREAFLATGGVEVDTQGDAFFVAFPEANGALAAAAQAQAALAAGPVRVRMGIHSGEPLLTDEGYVGIDVHRGARVMSAGHGGQVLVSEATYVQLDGTSALTELGRHRLKDLTEPQPLYQLGEEEFPPLKTLYQTNLPIQPTPLVGREQELAEVLALHSQARLVTLTGAGGSGKTRLGLQAAAELVDDYPQGVWWVSLAALRDPELVESTIAQVVGARDDLGEHLRGQKVLLLLDNFEHLLAAAPRIAALLGEAPELRVLATSRERLGLSSEQEYPVPTLIPAEAIALFSARARQLKPGFEPDEQVAEICRRLDGLPLAIELAAVRVKVLRPEQILDRLGKSLALLTAGARDAPERQRTLRATIEWSYELLSEDERELFAQLAVFAGSFDLEAAEAVCEAELDTLASLVDKSLLRQAEDGRFFMLETIREYGIECLKGEVAALRRRHTLYYLELAESAGPELTTPRARDWFSVLDSELANLRSATNWGLENDVEATLRILGSLWRFYQARPVIGEVRGLLAEALDRSKSGDPRIRVDALFAGARFAFSQGDYENARVLLDESLVLAQENDLRAGVALTLAGLGWVEDSVGSPTKAVDLSAQAVDVARSVGIDWVLADALNNLGVALGSLEAYDEARFAHEEALAIRMRIGEQEGVAASLGNLADVALEQGSLTEARALFERAAVVAEQWGHPWLQAMLLLRAASQASEQGDSRSATDLREEALEIARTHGYTGIEREVRELAERMTSSSERTDAALPLD